MKNGCCHISSKKYAKMVLFGLKTHFKKIFLGYFYPPTLPMQKNRVKMVPKQVFTRAGIKSPPPYSMSIPEAPSCRVKGFVSHTHPSFSNSCFESPKPSPRMRRICNLLFLLNPNLFVIRQIYFRTHLT